MRQHWQTAILALRLLNRDWRSGELHVLTLALILTVTATTAVGFFTDRLTRALHQQGSELLAADLAIDSAQPLPPALINHAQQLGLTRANWISWRSVIIANERTQLVEIKAVTARYPLRGALRWQSHVNQSNQSEHIETGGISLAAQHILVEPRLLILLKTSVGNTVKLGRSQFVIAGVLNYEPDRGGNLFAYAPRVLMNEADVAATDLVTPLSRVRHRLLIAGDETAVNAFMTWVKPQLPKNADLLDARTTRPELATAVDRAARFLQLAALVTLLVAGAALALASRRLVERQTDAVAIMRALGAPKQRLIGLFAFRLLWLGLIASGLGCFIGYIAQHGLIWLLADQLLNLSLPAASFKPAFIGFATGLIALAGFALPPLIQLAQVTPLRVLRRDLGTPRSATLFTAFTATAAMMILLLWQAGDLNLAMRVLFGVIGAVIALVLFAGMLILLARFMTRYSSGIWHLGLAGFARRPTAAVLQMTGFGLGILALLLLTVVRVDLLSAWQDSLPVNTPNQFLINIQPQEVAPLREYLATQDINDITLYPMIRGRLIGLAGRVIQPEDFPNERARRLVEREFNLSVASALQTDNQVIKGAWWETPAGLTTPQLSIESGIADTLGIQLGDELRFWVNGREIAAPVTSIRKVQWDSFNVNFFVIASPALLGEEPASFITSFYLPPQRIAMMSDLLAQFPSVTPIDVEAILTQVRRVIERGIHAVEYVLLFTLAAGFVVMIAGIQANLTARRRELAILRTFGAQRQQLLWGLLIEFGSLGLGAGLLAAGFAQFIAYLLAQSVLQLPFAWNAWLWLIGGGGSAIMIGSAGALSSYHLLVRPPLHALRLGE
ncbi:ABC transporter permease [Rhodoferax sp. 4810]|uniref:ABC transporter permease n=2 Tax=Thiospirillum jenense TaxID=1653858 RepID=A0A839H5E9_9GAMM|nr:ABC transporter permease [Rhodoferax jenense]MBB1125193.1 ABC transporter permease [Thiospirillum jenense]